MNERKNTPIMSVKTLAYCAMLAALSIVLARITAFAPIPEMRFSLDKFPLFLAGMFFGPLTGGIVGFAADTVGCLISPFGFNPILCPPAILYGVFGGIFRMMLKNKFTIPRLALAYLFPIVIGSWLYQSAALALAYSPATFWEAFLANLGYRGIQFTIMLVLEVMIIYLLTNAKIFDRLGIWQTKK